MTWRDDAVWDDFGSERHAATALGYVPDSEHTDGARLADGTLDTQHDICTLTQYPTETPLEIS